MIGARRRREQLEAAHVELSWRRAGRDPGWFFENMVWIPSQRDQRGREPFELMEHQVGDLDTMLSERFVIVLKARQLGLSTLVMGLALWTCLFRPGSVVLIFSKNQEAANKALGILKVMWQFLPAWVKERAPVLDAESTKHLTWRFGDGMTSTVKSFAATKTAGAGETATLVILDEMALYEDPANTYRTVVPTTDAGGRMIVVSTARGAHNHFAELYRGAKRGENQFVPVFHPWWVSPFVDQSIYDAKQKEFSAEPWLFYAEYPSSEEEAFRESGRPRFGRLPAIEDCDEFPYRGRLVDDGWGNPVWVEDDQGPLRLADGQLDPSRLQDYVLAVDPATGQGLDYTAGHVLTTDGEGQIEVVAYWHSNVTEQVVAARDFALVGRWFTGHRGPALLVPEKVGGWADAMILTLQRELNYPRLYIHKLTGHRKRGITSTVGFPMHWQRRPLVIDRLAEFVNIDDDRCIGGIHPLLRSELGTFVTRDDGKVAADVGCHDDLVMSLAIGLWVLVEEGGGATQPHVVEAPRPEHSVAYIFDEAEKVRSQEALQARRAIRSFEAARRHRSRRR